MIILSKIVGALSPCEGYSEGVNVNNVPCELQRPGLLLDGRETHVQPDFTSLQQ